MSSSETVHRARELVDRFADGPQRFASYQALDEIGNDALPAVREGLGNGNWQVRRWCAIYLDHHADLESIEYLVPLVRDPKAAVRMWAVHSVACDRCKSHENPVDYVPLLIERIEIDESIRVRRMAVTMLAYGDPDARAVPVFESILRNETDRKLRLHAEGGLERCRAIGLATRPSG